MIQHCSGHALSNPRGTTFIAADTITNNFFNCAKSIRLPNWKDCTRCNATSAGIQLSLQVTRCQLKNRISIKPLPSSSARDFFRSQSKGNYFSVSHREHRNSRVPVCKKTFINFMTIKTIYSRNNMDINVVLCLSYVNYLEGGMLFNLCLIGYPMLFAFLNL